MPEETDTQNHSTRAGSPVSACSEFWKQVGKSHRHVSRLLRESGYNEVTLIKEVQKLGAIFEEGAKFYTQNAGAQVTAQPDDPQP